MIIVLLVIILVGFLKLESIHDEFNSAVKFFTLQTNQYLKDINLLNKRVVDLERETEITGSQKSIDSSLFYKILQETLDKNLVAYNFDNSLHVASENITGKKIKTSRGVEEIIGWNSTGEWLIYKSNIKTNIIFNKGGYLYEGDFYLVNINTGEEVFLNDIFGVDLIEGLQILPDDKIIFGHRASRDLEETNIYTINIDGTEKKEIYKSPTNIAWIDSELVVGKRSPDEKFVAFEYGGSPSYPYGKIDILNLEDKKLKELAQGSNVIWLYDGRLVYSGINNSKEPGIYIFDKNLKSSIKIIDGGAFSLSFSEDKNIIAYSKSMVKESKSDHKVSEAVFISSINGENINKIYESRWSLRNLNLSSDGIWLSFIEYGQGFPMTYLYNRETMQIYKIGYIKSIVWYVLSG